MRDDGRAGTGPVYEGAWIRDLRRAENAFMMDWEPGDPVPEWAVECDGARPTGDHGPHLRRRVAAGVDGRACRPDLSSFEEARESAMGGAPHIVIIGQRGDMPAPWEKGPWGAEP